MKPDTTSSQEDTASAKPEMVSAQAPQFSDAHERIEPMPDIERVEAPEPEERPAQDSATPPEITSPIFVSRNVTFPEVLFSLGLASIFFVYAAVAYLQPDAVANAYNNNLLGRAIGHEQIAAETSMFINIFLGVLAFMKRWRAVVYSFAGGWLLVIALFKALNLLG